MSHAIVFAANMQLLPHLETAIKSLCHHHHYTPLHFYILNDDIPKPWFDTIQDRLKALNHQISSIRINSARFRNFNKYEHSGVVAYYRFMLGELIPESKALYLNCDVVVEKDITELLTLPLDDSHLLAAVNDSFMQYHWELPYLPKGNYFNSGVMLVDLEKWRTYDVAKRLLTLADKFSHQVKYGDQCILNLLLRDKTFYLPEELNFQVGFIETLNYFEVDFTIQNIDQMTIVHFTSFFKPWYKDFPNIFLKDRYWHYRNMAWNKV